MGSARFRKKVQMVCALLCAIAWSAARAAEYRGQVLLNGLPVPGATVTATGGGREFTAITDQQGAYAFADLPDGNWTIAIAMTGFVSIRQEVAVGPGTQPGRWELKLESLGEIHAQPAAPLPGSAVARDAASAGTASTGGKSAARPSETAQENGGAGRQEEFSGNDGFLINGSVNNAATSSFAMAPAFGNKRNGANPLYTGGLGLTLDNSALDARPYSLTGLNTAKPSYNDLTGMATLGGPVKIPHLFQNGPNVFVAYEWTRDRSATTDSARVPDAAEREGDFSQTLNAAGQPVEVFDPATGLPFLGNVIPENRISPQARALMKFYPLPNFDGGTRYNYQTPIISDMHQDALQSRFQRPLNAKNYVWGGFAFQSSRTGIPSVFGFLDTTDVLGINTSANWWHRFNQRLSMNPGFQYSRLRTRVTPYFENRQNVSGEAGIAGNDQDPQDWGPPGLTFASGIAGLSDAESADNRNQTAAVSYSMLWVHDRHNVTFGGDLRRQEFNYLSQQNPRGMFTFTGAATGGQVNGAVTGGSDLADWLLGIPDTSAIAYGNADKYFRESVYDAYVTDDWRVRPELTVNAGVRWEYGAPITELYDRLVNLDLTAGFAAAAPMLASDPVGPLTGEKYPSSLLRRDHTGIEPRIGVAWRPVSGSSMVVRAGYGIYYDTSIYQTIATQMAQQAPLSKSLSVENSAACPLTLANGFAPCSVTTADTFAVDPNYRAGYAQNWQLSVQRDLPGSLQMTATYLGTKGTRGGQEFLPNTYPEGGTNPCPECPVGFAYLTSGGDSTRQAGQLQLRRRLHIGVAGMLEYTYSKAIDDDSILGGQGASAASQNGAAANAFTAGAAGTTGASQGSGGNTPTLAQNWRDLGAERGLSTFDQRHLLNLQLQYTSGMGLAGGTLLRGWRGTLLKEWTALTEITAASGLPETPTYVEAVPGTGVTGSIRPNATGAPIYAAPAGFYLNPAAWAAPAPGEWGDARRDSITGPAQFGLNLSLARTFRLNDRYNIDLRVDSTNALNHVTFTTWDTFVTSPQFGLPAAANAMRSMQTTLRLRF